MLLQMMEKLYVGYRIARDLEDHWELMRPGKTRYEDWTNEQIQERFGNVEERMEAMSLEDIIKNYQERVEEECQGDNPFLIDESTVESLKQEVKVEKEMIEKEKEEEEEREMKMKEEEENEIPTNPSLEIEEDENEEEYETNEYYMTREDLEKMMNDDGTITINGQRLKIEEIMDVGDEEMVDEEVPFLEVVEEEFQENKMDKAQRRQKLRENNQKRRSKGRR